MAYYELVSLFSRPVETQFSLALVQLSSLVTFTGRTLFGIVSLLLIIITVYSMPYFSHGQRDADHILKWAAGPSDLDRSFQPYNMRRFFII